MRFGPNSTQVAILRRAVIAGAPGGRARGDYALSHRTWASWRAISGREIVEAGLAQDAVDLAVRVNDTPRNRAITAADRLSLLGGDYDIVSAGLPDRLGGFIELTVRRHIGG